MTHKILLVGIIVIFTVLLTMLVGSTTFNYATELNIEGFECIETANNPLWVPEAAAGGCNTWTNITTNAALDADDGTTYDPVTSASYWKGMYITIHTDLTAGTVTTINATIIAHNSNTINARVRTFAVFNISSGLWEPTESVSVAADALYTFYRNMDSANTKLSDYVNTTNGDLTFILYKDTAASGSYGVDWFNVTINYQAAPPSMCTPTVNVDWIISDAQTCSTDQNIGSGNIIINTGGTLTLISNADVTANNLQLNVVGDSVFINSGSELRVAA